MNIKELRTLTGLSQSKFAEKYNISVRTLQGWETAHKTPPPYVTTMLERLVLEDFQPMQAGSKNIKGSYKEPKNPEK